MPLFRSFDSLLLCILPRQNTFLLHILKQCIVSIWRAWTVCIWHTCMRFYIRFLNEWYWICRLNVKICCTVGAGVFFTSGFDLAVGGLLSQALAEMGFAYDSVCAANSCERVSSKYFSWAYNACNWYTYFDRYFDIYRLDTLPRVCVYPPQNILGQLISLSQTS